MKSGPVLLYKIKPELQISRLMESYGFIVCAVSLGAKETVTYTSKGTYSAEVFLFSPSELLKQAWGTDNRLVSKRDAFLTLQSRYVHSTVAKSARLFDHTICKYFGVHRL